MNKQKWMIIAAFTCLLSAGLIVGCGTLGEGILFPGSGLVIPLTPKFLVAIDSDVGTTVNANVFPINSGTGALGAAVPGSPFDLGLSDAMTIAVHPNGHWIYVADGKDGTIHAYDVDTTTGKPTAIAAAVKNESGSFYEPSGQGDSPTHVITITPNGQFLYASNNDSKVSAYSIGSNGALTHIGDLDLGARSTGAITATDSFVWVTDTDPNTCPNGPGDNTPEYVHVMSIGGNGVVTKVNKATLTNVYCWLWSIAVSPDGKIVQVGDEGGAAQVYSFTVGADGSLTQVGPQVVENSSSDCRDIAFSPDGKFFYTTDDDDVVHAVTQNVNGSITELAASPYNGNNGDGQIAVDLTGKFVYTGSSFQVDSFTRNASTGALTAIGPSTPTANNEALAIGIIRVSP